MSVAAKSLGIYLSVPFCKAKCSFCNFASGVYPAESISAYLHRLVTEMHELPGWVTDRRFNLPQTVDSIYLGGGTPSLLSPEDVRRLFSQLRSRFDIVPHAEVTVECAPGQLEEATIEAFLREGVNRVSFGVQSFVDEECKAIGRLHIGAECRQELHRLQAAGVKRLGIDLIAGLPHQTDASWRYSIEQAMESGVEHVSLYMLEVDDDSRLGREALRGGRRYGAQALPQDDRVADWYGMACEWLETAGLSQYEISNFARAGGQSRHNRKYWTREPYVGFGLDAHSMLRGHEADLRWANTSEMREYTGGPTLNGLGSRGFARTIDRIDRVAAFEEAVFLGLRLVEGVSLAGLRAEFGSDCTSAMSGPAEELIDAALLTLDGDRMRLTARGRTVSNEIFERLLVAELVS